MTFIKGFEIQAKKIFPRIIYPESEDKRVLQAVIKIYKSKLAQPILIGNPQKINKDLHKFGLKKHTIEIIDNTNYKNINSLAEKFFKLREKKEMNLNKAKKILKTNKIYFATMLVKTNKADALISGSICTTAQTIRPALQIIKGRQNRIVSSAFFMIIKNKIMIFSDCALNIKPNSKELSDIAISTYETAKEFGINPRMAFLSFSTNGSAKHQEIKRIKKAVKITKEKIGTKCVIDGEMQLDAAIVPHVSKIKFPSSKIKGNANVLIFPDLNAGNIGYKLVERLGNAKAIGPILQGLKKPVNDLSRGCSIQDIINNTIITAIQVRGIKK